MTEHDREKFEALREKVGKAKTVKVQKLLKEMDDNHLSLDDRKQKLKKAYPDLSENERTFLLFCGLDFR